jgi:hypothetical protein
VQGAPVMAQPQRADRDVLDGAADAAALDVLADPEGVVQQEEHSGDDVFHQRLGAKADREANHAGAGDQRS